MKIIAGNANPKLAQEICKYLKIPLADALVATFSEGEIRVKIDENVRGRDVFIIQPTCPPVNDNLMELLILIDALKRASAKRITAVLPYFGYARQDRKDQPRVPITAKLVANLITKAGADRILTVDLHAGQIQGFFDIPMDHLYAVNIFVNHIKKIKLKDIVIVSPDVGGIKMARAYAKKFEAPLAIVDKRRISGEETEAMNILGDIKGKNLIIIDDLVATASSLVEAAAALKKQGGKEIYAAITHPVLSGPAIKRINDSVIKKLFVTNTIPVENGKKHKKIEVLSIAPLLAEAIKRIHDEESVSCLFN
ncbi:MAG: phosphoribosylpyrophosphate synthetase [Candidatus Omnitrophica bacterium CG22_combo_CG10-13_8_21_14_all_43_16]|nr:MAG: phosphoribosylpyrophosphate synthetase [Candidatus Omnitrophica bacterium CG22_combo_CG10-13_8_21_14_all_43_16]